MMYTICMVNIGSRMLQNHLIGHIVHADYIETIHDNGSAVKEAKGD